MPSRNQKSTAWLIFEIYNDRQNEQTWYDSCPHFIILHPATIQLDQVTDVTSSRRPAWLKPSTLKVPHSRRARCQVKPPPPRPARRVDPLEKAERSCSAMKCLRPTPTCNYPTLGRMLICRNFKLNLASIKVMDHGAQNDVTCTFFERLSLVK